MPNFTFIPLIVMALSLIYIWVVIHIASKITNNTTGLIFVVATILTPAGIVMGFAAAN